MVPPDEIAEPPPARRRPGLSRVLLVVKPVIGLGILAFLLSRVERATLRSLTERAGPVSLALITAVALGGHALGAARFKLLCDAVIRLPLRQHLAQYFSAACFNVLLPSSMGGDGLRLLFLTRSGLKWSEAGSLIFVERVIGFQSLLIVSAVAGLLAPIPTWVRAAVVVAATGAGLALAVAAWLGARVKPRQAWLAAALGAARETVRGGRRFWVVLTSSVVYQTACILVTVVVNSSLGLGIPTITVLALSPLVWFATLLPISVGGVGVREAGFVVVFSLAGVSSEKAIVLSLGTYAGLIVTGVAGAIWFAVERVRVR